MYIHLVLCKLKSEAEGRSKAENAKLGVEKIEGLNSSIPEIRMLDVGTNIGKYGASFF